MSDLLLVNDLRVHFPVRRSLDDILRRRPRATARAVDGVSLSVAPGEILAIVGESGCGKTTLGLAILRLQHIDGGGVWIDGTDVTTLSGQPLRALRRRAQMIFQDPYDSLDSRFRVRDIVAEPLRIHEPRATKAAREELVREALEKVGLTPPDLFLDRFPHELSGGQRQRVAIAAALVLRPRLLVADEPVSMLDVSVRAGVLGLLDQLRRDGLGILMITHDLATVAHYADRVAVMYLGRVVEEGSAEEVIHNPRHPYTRALVAVAPRMSASDETFPLLRGEVPNASRIATGCRFRPRCPWARVACADIDPALREAGPATHRAACILVGPEAPESGAISAGEVS